MTAQHCRIDAHHHLWRYSAEQYDWISGPMAALRRDFLPQDLQPLLQQAELDGAIAVQARQDLAETHWLLQQAAQHPWMRGVVGWAPIAASEFPEVLATLRAQQKLKGLRHVIQDEPDDDFILGAEFGRGIAALRDTGLVYDILIYARHLPQTIRFVDRHPEQNFVLDHCGKPPLRGVSEGEGAPEPWASHIRELAKRRNLACKVSGLVTEAGWQQWTPALLEPCWRVVLEAFGPGRILFGSDWPVARLACKYQRWVETVLAWTAPLSAAEQAAIWGENAARIYKLG